MITLSRKARYALRALIALAGEGSGSYVLIADLAAKENIPHKFLESILLQLKNAGILVSKKGKGGGYALIKPPDQITLGQAIHAIDGSLSSLPCLIEPGVRCQGCLDEATCSTRLLMERTKGAVATILDGTTLASLCLPGLPLVH